MTATLTQRPTVLYRFFDGDGVLLYVGITCDFRTRTAAHMRKAWAADVSRIEVERFDGRQEAQEAESRAIRDEHPIYNAARPFPPWQADDEDEYEDDADPVGILEIAQRLQVARGTVAVWHHRKRLPPPPWIVSGAPVWNWPDIRKWAEQTGRLPKEGG